MTDHKRGVEAAALALANRNSSEHPEAFRGIAEAAISAYLSITEPGKPESGVLAVKVKVPAEYRRIHDVAAAAYEAATPVDYRYSALALRKAVDAAIAALTTPPQPVEAHKKLELWFFRDMFESNRLALFSLFGFKAEHVDTMAKQQKSFRHILRNEGAK